MQRKNIPNILSTIRLALVPVFVMLFLYGFKTAAIIVFILAGITDVIDGYIARKYNFISNLGKVLDPLADKFLQLSAFICLYISELIPLWMPVVYFIKELATSLGALIVFRKKKLVTKSNVFGKLATFLVFAFVCIVAIFGDIISSGAITVMCIFICLYFVFSCAMYVRQNSENNTNNSCLDGTKQ